VAQGRFSWDRAVEIGQLIRSDWNHPGAEGWSVFKSVGLAAQDLALADLLYERAIEDPQTPRVELTGAALGVTPPALSER